MVLGFFQIKKNVYFKTVEPHKVNLRWVHLVSLKMA